MWPCLICPSFQMAMTLGTMARSDVRKHSRRDLRDLLPAFWFKTFGLMPSTSMNGAFLKSTLASSLECSFHLLRSLHVRVGQSRWRDRPAPLPPPKRHRGNLLEASCVPANGLGRRRETVAGFPSRMHSDSVPQSGLSRRGYSVICAGKAVLHDVDEFLHRVNSGVANFVSGIVNDVFLVICEIVSMIAEIISQIVGDVVLVIDPINSSVYNAFDVAFVSVFVHVFARLFEILGRIDDRLANLLDNVNRQIANVGGGFDDACSTAVFTSLTPPATVMVVWRPTPAGAATAADLSCFLGAADDFFPAFFNFS